MLHKTVSRISASLSTSSSRVAISRAQPNAALIVFHRIGSRRRWRRCFLFRYNGLGKVMTSICLQFCSCLIAFYNVMVHKVPPFLNILFNDWFSNRLLVLFQKKSTYCCLCHKFVTFPHIHSKFSFRDFLTFLESFPPQTSNVALSPWSAHTPPIPTLVNKVDKAGSHPPISPTRNPYTKIPPSPE